MHKVTAVALLALLGSSARAAGWSSSDELRRRTADQEPAIFRAVTDRGGGDVRLCSRGSCREGFDGRPLREGDVVKTGPDGRCDIVVENGGRLRVLENTDLEVVGKGARCGFRLMSGTVLSALDEADCLVESPQASAWTRGSRFRVDFKDGAVARFSVVEKTAKLVAGPKPRALRSRWWAGKAPMKARVLEDAAGTLVRRSGEVLRGGAAGREGDSLEIGDVLETSAGASASVALAAGFAVVLDESTRLAFAKRDERWGLTLLRGRIYVVRLEPGGAPSPLVSAGASAAYEGSDEFEASWGGDSAPAAFSVFSGSLAVRASSAR